MRLHVEVTAEDIARGERGNCARCPVALALRRAVGEGVSGMAVDAAEITLCVDGRIWRAATPEAASNFIDTFDGLQSAVEPFAFDVELRG